MISWWKMKISIMGSLVKCWIQLKRNQRKGAIGLYFCAIPMIDNDNRYSIDTFFEIMANFSIYSTFSYSISIITNLVWILFYIRIFHSTISGFFSTRKLHCNLTLYLKFRQNIHKRILECYLEENGDSEENGVCTQIPFFLWVVK